MKKWAILLLAVCTIFGLGFITQAKAAPYTVGDVFASIGSSQVKEFTPTGTLVQTLNDASGATFTTGSAFDASGNFYVTNFGATVSKFDNSGNLLNTNFITGLSSVESILFDKSGNIYVGDAGSNLIHKYNSAGTLLNTFTAAIESRGTDWIDLAANQQTMLYTSEGTHVKSFNVGTNTQNPDFASGLPGSAAYALRILANGNVLVADSSVVVQLDAGGNIIKTYTLPGSAGGIFSLNLDPNGLDFWAGDFNSNNVWEVNIATGAIDQQWNVGAAEFFGLSVFGEITQGGGGGGAEVPEPATMLLLGSGLVGLAGYARRRMKK